MIGSAFQKRVLASRREHRDLPKQGWEYLGEGGGKLWELYRGYRIGYEITEVRIAASGTALWIKTEDKSGR
jgi:hypothetical protein